MKTNKTQVILIESGRNQTAIPAGFYKLTLGMISEVCTGDSDYTWGEDVEDEGVAAAEAPLLEDGMNVGSAEATLAVRKACMKNNRS